MRETFFQISIIFSILLITFTLAINFVSALGVFGEIDFETGIDTESSLNNDDVSSISDEVFVQLSGFTGGMGQLWFSILTITGIGTIVVAILMHSAIPIGVWIFSAVFWSSYIRCINVINVGGIFTTNPMLQFLIILTVGLIFIWIGALAGMFGGSG
jgi:hypothetical protein